MSKCKINKEFDKSINLFCFINNGEMIVNFQNMNYSVKLEEIRKVLFFKRRKLHWNIFFLFISSVFFVLFYLVDLIFYFQVIFLGSCLIGFIMSFIFRSYEYKFVLIKKYDFIEFIINKELIKDVKELIKDVEKFNSQLNTF